MVSPLCEQSVSTAADFFEHNRAKTPVILILMLKPCQAYLEKGCNVARVMDLVCEFVSCYGKLERRKFVGNVFLLVG